MTVLLSYRCVEALDASTVFKAFQPLHIHERMCYSEGTDVCSQQVICRNSITAVAESE